MTISALASYPLPLAASFPVNKVGWSLDSKRAVLLIHDMQEYFVDYYGQNSPLIAQVQENIAGLRDWCDTQGIPVVYTAQPSEQSPEDRALLNDMWGPGLTVADPERQQVVSGLRPRPDDTVLVKWRYSAFYRSKLQEMMFDWGRDQLLICGIYAHIGCLTTALDAFMRDIQPFMVGDAVADFSAEEHLIALKYVAGRCGKVVSTASLIQSHA